MNFRTRAADEQARAWLPPRAALFYFLVLGTAMVVTVPLLARLDTRHDEPWGTFVVLAACAGIAHLLVVITPNHESYAIAIVFMIPAALLLPPELAALVAISQFIPDWIRARRPWYIQTFNICDSVLAVLLAAPMISAGQASAPAKAAPATVININTATADQLDALPGIGAKLAARIVDYRQKNGGFKKVEDLMNVQGIGEKNFLKLKPLITLGQPKAEKGTQHH